MQVCSPRGSLFEEKLFQFADVSFLVMQIVHLGHGHLRNKSDLNILTFTARRDLWIDLKLTLFFL